MKHISLYILIFCMFLVGGCGDKDIVTIKHGVSQYKNSTIEINKAINDVDITIDSGKLKIYLWDKMEIKFVAKHTIRGSKTIEELEKQLDRYSIMSEKQGKVFLFKVDYKGKIIDPQDIYTDIELTIPRRIKKINISEQFGSLTVEDKFEGDIVAKLDSVNSEIKMLKGKLVYEGKSGNLRLNSGRLLNGSCVEINSGNIYIKTECQEKSKYLFQTETGNIELNFPISSKVLLESFGTVQNNQFAGMEGNIEVKTSTNMGKISVNGY